MPKNHIFVMKFAKVYPLYVQKAERKNRTNPTWRIRGSKKRNRFKTKARLG